MTFGNPILATGKFCHLLIPAVDVELSSRFYRDAFDWDLRDRGDGDIAFDDAVKEVSGSWVTGRPALAEPGIMVHIMVADLTAGLAHVRAAGGEVLNDDVALSDGAAGINFYKAAFDAEELGERYHMPDGTLVHSELLIGDSVVMVKDARDSRRRRTTRDLAHMRPSAQGTVVRDSRCLPVRAGRRAVVRGRDACHTR
jgi:predicted enzyme related to lactoylglutathione lyase